MRVRTLALIGSLLTAIGVLVAPGASGAPASIQSTCPSVGGDWAGTGPFAVSVRSSGVGHTLYHPSDLGGLGCGTHPVLLWGNGTGASPSNYDALLKHLASHGLVVAAANTQNAGTGREILAGLDYLTSENARSGSVFHGKIDTARVGATGHSQGGGGAIAAGADRRVGVTVPIQPGPGDITKLHGPMFLLAGQYDTVVPAWWLRQRFNDAGRIVGIYGELAGANHFTPVGNGGGYRGPITAWLRLHLLGDEQARGLFFGTSCGYCGSPTWSQFIRNAKAQAVPGA